MSNSTTFSPDINEKPLAAEVRGQFTGVDNTGSRIPALLLALNCRIVTESCLWGSMSPHVSSVDRATYYKTTLMHSWLVLLSWSIAGCHGVHLFSVLHLGQATSLTKIGCIGCEQHTTG